MITSIKIERLRGIREGELTDLTPLVILVGPNGCGKSTVLDAMLIGAHPVPGEGIGIAAGRHGGTQMPGQWLLWQAGRELPAFIQVTFAGGASRTAQLDRVEASGDQRTIHGAVSQGSERLTTYCQTGPKGRGGHGQARIDGDGPQAVHLVDPRRPDRPTLDQLWSDLRRDGRRDEANAALKVLLPTVETGDILTEIGRPVVYADFGAYAVPIAVTGDGVHDLVHLSLELAVIPEGLALLEEPEAHLHPAAIRQAAKVVWAAVRRGVQVVISTHSLELIDALLAEAGDDLEKLSAYMLRLDNGKLINSRLPGESVRVAREAIQEDLR